MSALLHDQSLTDAAHAAYCRLAERVLGCDEMIVNDRYLVGIDDDGESSGSRKDGVGSIVVACNVFPDVTVLPAMTWDEARAVALAILEVTETADRG